jgi:DNA primase
MIRPLVWTLRTWTATRAKMTPSELLLHVVRGRVPSLRLERGHWRGDCPWCDEEGELFASFFVYPDRFHCFACGAAGDAITFLMREEGLSFLAAVAWLARDAGVPVR